MSDRPSPLRRILVAFSAARRSLAVLEPAARLARRMDAGLLGVFLEDEDLLRLASLPFARLVGLTSKPLPIDRPAMERALRKAQADARYALELAAQQHGVRQAFRVVRAPVSEAFAAVAEAGDLIVLERAELGRTLAAAVACAEVSVLCLSEASPSAGAVAIVFETGAAGSERLEIAAQVAAVAGRELLVISAEPGTADVEREVSEVAARAGVRARLQFLFGHGPVPPSAMARAGALIALSRTVLRGESASEGAKMFESCPSILVLR